MTVATLVDRLKINGSLARKCLKDLEEKGMIKQVVGHSKMKIYSAVSPSKANRHLWTENTNTQDSPSRWRWWWRRSSCREGVIFGRSRRMRKAGRREPEPEVQKETRAGPIVASMGFSLMGIAFWRHLLRTQIKLHLSYANCQSTAPSTRVCPWWMAPSFVSWARDVRR